MTAARIRVVPLAILAALATSACAARPAAPGPVSPPASPSAAEFEAIYRARTDSARLRFTDADVQFMTRMIVHHAQGLVMAGMVPANGATPAVRTLAARITNTQQDEIATMQQWLRDRGQPVPEVHAHGTGVMMHGADHGSMPGMLTDAELRGLQQARGPDFDRRFLDAMIRHHRGAVVMVEELLATDGAGQDEQVFRFAADAQVDQTTEIARMEQLRNALPAAAGAP
ncbi:MAG TPA: DUF305 domain-containing protein [Longimicrobiales bacterium]|nr:DUF305 domain-containing protein [Longimicrobiales bacterium]